MEIQTQLLRRFKEDILKALPDEIVMTKVFGSYARGEARGDSDIDVLIVTKSDDWRLIDKIGEFAYNILLETGIYISTKVISRRHYEYLQRLNAPFIVNVLREGVAL